MTESLLRDQLVAYGRSAPRALEALPLRVVLRSARLALRMTQAQLARRADVPQSHVAVIETGRREATLRTLRKLFRALGAEMLLVPRFRKEPDELLAERAREVARRNVRRVAGTMALEDQLPDAAALERLVAAEEERVRRLGSSELWDEP